MSASPKAPKWEYRVIHINVDNQTPPQPPDPQVASQKMGGALSPEFITREFPQVYGPNQQAQAPPKHPAEQLQHFLNLLGQEGWEMTTTAQVGQLLMFFFKRPLPQALSKTTAEEAASGENGLA
ncbi:hypothetical protein [Vulcanococcus sp.]|jgi:hypothetical protein|uniref:hypothetical protein n=1 Tax=Vulcanococcus sp. TaxID=2856995 RepID=UPI0037DA3675